MRPDCDLAGAAICASFCFTRPTASFYDLCGCSGVGASREKSARRRQGVDFAVCRFLASVRGKAVTMGIRERSAERRKRIVVNRARTFKEAEQWDLDYWQSLTPEQRLSVLVAMHRDIEKMRPARSRHARRRKRPD
jgi:hypothetical protein